MAERRLVETMPLQGSPHGLVLRAARDALCAAGLAVGVTLVLVEEWEELERLNARHRSDWFPLLPRPAAAPFFWVAAVDADGEFVATHGVVMLDCSAASFGVRVGDLTAFHDPGAAPVGEFGFCASPSAHETRGAVAWIVAGWNRPDWCGRGLLHLLGTMARLVALDRWSPRWVIGLVDPETVPVWVRRCAGRALLEPLPACSTRRRTSVGCRSTSRAGAGRRCCSTCRTQAFGSNTTAATQHHITSGRNEGRAVTFDASACLARYADLRAAYGSNTTAATMHYVISGYREGRSAAPITTATRTANALSWQCLVLGERVQHSCRGRYAGAFPPDCRGATMILGIDFGCVPS